MGTATLTGGEVLQGVHDEELCKGRGIPCVIHSPSDHHMRDWPLHWRSDTGVMERICPHGTGHPDPDALAYTRSLTPEHKCVLDVIRALGMYPSTNPYCGPGYFYLSESEQCPLPHLEWQAVHGCDLCCRGPENVS